MKPSDLLYRVWNGHMEVATFLQEQILEGATLPSWTVRYDDGRKAITSPDFWELTTLRAWKRYQKETAEAIPSLNNAVREAQKQAEFAEDQLEIATSMVHRLSGGEE